MTIRLYTGLGSGNAYKAELMLHLLDVSYEPVPVSIPKGEHRDPAFVRLNPFGQIPVLVDGMDAHLRGRAWLATDEATVADVACYPYLLLAAEGGIDTAPFAQVTAWMRRVEGLPRFWPMPRIPNLPPVPLVPPPG